MIQTATLIRLLRRAARAGVPYAVIAGLGLAACLFAPNAARAQTPPQAAPPAAPGPADAPPPRSGESAQVPPEERLADDDRSSAARKLWRPIDVLNPGTPPGDGPLNRATPRAALANFMDAAAAGDYAKAARVLDLSFLPASEQGPRAETLAQQLHYLLDRKVSIDWRAIPDRRDGSRASTQGQEALAPEPRRYIQVAEMTLNGRPVDILLERVKPRGVEPLWVFPPSTVEQVPALYAAEGPSFLQRRLPDVLTDHSVLDVPVWEWLGLLLVGAGCLTMGWLTRVVMTRLWWRRSDARWTEGLTDAISTPLILLLSFSTFKVLIGALLSLTGPILRVIDDVTLVLIVASGTWLGMRLVTHVADVFGSAFLSRSESEDDPKARRRLTQISVGKRIVVFIVVVIGIGVGLSYFEGSSTVGLSFLFSAGAVSIIVGIAAQSVLSNVLAGVQIAVTEPVRIGDNVVFDGEWGWVEEIAYTYVTIRIWDKRRLVVPHSYFLSKPVENWSKTAPQMIMPIFLYADYRVPVEAVRTKLAEILEERRDWDRAQPPSVYVTKVTEEVIELRALVSARDPLTAWYLQVEVREMLVTFLQELEDGRYLPRRRLQPTDDDKALPRMARVLRSGGDPAADAAQ